MKLFKNLSISRRLIIGFVLIALIATLVGAVGLINIKNISDADTLLYEENVLGIEYSTKAATYYQRLRYNIAEMIILKDDSMRDDFIGKFDNFIATIDTALENYEEGIISAEDRKLYDELEPLWTQYRAFMQEAIKYAREGQYDKVQQVLLGDADAVGSQLQDAFGTLVDYNDATAVERSATNRTLASTSGLVMIIVIAAGVVLAIVLGLIISRSISKPIFKMVEAADKLAVGDVNVNVKADRKDEIGHLAESFERMIANIRAQAQAAERIAAGDLTVQVDVRSENDLLGQKLFELVKKNNEVLSNIASAADQVASGSKQISDSSMALSQGATEQASSIEELTASIEQISSQTKFNTQNANQANELAENAKSEAIRGNAQMQEMLKAMEEINEASANISKIIKVIDDIAFQTNMLALNAAVEAARAGQHGKGFAVVAEEVKNLAARSANAAKETTEMIEGSIKKTEGGTKVAQATAQALDKIVNEIEKVANLIGDISVASNEQEQGIGQINQGIMQVSQVVQTNSATSEETAAASEELSSQAELLKEMVGQYKLKKTSKSYNEFSEISPEVLKMLDNMSGKKKADQAHYEDTYEDAASKIVLSDREFGKY